MKTTTNGAEMTKAAARKARGMRIAELFRWADRAAALGVDEVATCLRENAIDASEDPAVFARWVEKARAALLLEVFTLGATDEELEPA